MATGRARTPHIATFAVASEGGTVHVVEVDGPLELPTVPALRGELARLTEGGATRLLIDLTSVDFIDLAGVAALHRAGLAGCAIAIAVPTGSQPARTLALCRLDPTIPAFADRAGAFAALA